MENTPRHESVITLTIRETGTATQHLFMYDVEVDGDVIARNQQLSPATSQAVREVSRRYSTLFEQDSVPHLTTDNLQALGVELFQMWLAPVWPEVAARVPPRTLRLLVIASDVADVLNLPWELLRPAGGDFIGFDPRFSIRRLPWVDRRLAPFAGVLPVRPLRIVFMACAPQDQDLLDYEREEAFLLRAVARTGPHVVLDTVDLGTFEELRQRINEFQPHIVHLTGHGMVENDGLGYFAFEDERGATDLRSSVEISQQLFAGSSVQCAFISSCQTGKAPSVAVLGGICQGLVGYEVPLAIGWAASIADDIASRFATTFYSTLAAGQPLDRALTQARQTIRKACEDRGDPSWTLPVLYAATRQGQVVDPDPQRPHVPLTRPSVVQQPLPGMTEGYAAHFVGRRRELQRLLPALRDGTLQLVLITGLGGTGKSTLATRLARRLEADGFTPIPMVSTVERPLSAARLLEICSDSFLAAGLHQAHTVLRDGNLSEDERLRYLVNVLNQHRFVVVLDNFEVNLDESSHHIKDGHLARFYTHLLSHLVGNSRAIITCRYHPADVLTLPSTVHEEPLGDFTQGDFLKFLLRDATVEQRYYTGELPHALLVAMHRLLGGTPRFLEQIRQVLTTIPAADLQQALSAVHLPTTAEPAALVALRDRYCEQIFTARLYAHLSPEAQRALSQAAVYEIPVTLAGLAAVTGETEAHLHTFTRTWQSYALAYPEHRQATGVLWTVYGVLRGWLLTPDHLSPDERRAAHQAAGDFLRDLEQHDHAGELGLSWVDCLLEASAQYLAAGAYEEARAVIARISRFFTRQGLYEEVARLNAKLLDYEKHPAPMLWIGRSYLDRGQYNTAREWYQRCLEATSGVGSQEEAEAWHGLATIELRQGNYAAARAQFQTALTIRQQIGDRAGEANTQHQLASIELDQGNYAAARTQFQTALAIYQQIGDRAGEANTQHQLASIELDQGNYAAARTQFQMALTIYQQIGDRAGEATAQHQLASIELDRATTQPPGRNSRWP